MESVKDTARLTRILSKEHSNPSFLKKLDGTWTESSAESLQLLMDTHFPDCSDEGPTDDDPDNLDAQSTSLNTIQSIITEEKIAWAINSFAPYKSPGLDGILPVMLQELQDIVIPWLVVVFRSCVLLKHIPETWKRVKVVFIPKAGRRGHELAKDFRPISLTSFVLKTLERVLDTHLRQTIATATISKSQHAYCKGRSVETALHEVVRTIEHSIHYKQYTLAAFLDIEGAFNNVRTAAIQESLAELGVHPCLRHWIIEMLRSRIIQSEMGNTHVVKSVRRGTPQGGVLSPLLWLMVMNKILLRLDRDGVKVVAYADDVVILVSGMFPSVISEIMEGALDKISKWSQDCGLNVNPSKTELMLFTTKTKIPNFTLPKLDGQTLSLSTSAKYLGVILDPKLNWKKNIEERVKKACIAFYACKRTFGKKWGLRPRMVLWIYTAVVRPILSYGAVAWWPALSKGYNKSKLGRVQRTACVGTTGALRTTPTDALNVILHLLPPDLQIQYQASCSALRLKESGCWNAKPYGHSNILGSLPGGVADISTDYITPELVFDKGFTVKIPTRGEWEDSDLTKDYDTALFTDGSKMECGVGAGIFSGTLGISRSYRLPNNSSIFQAEVLAVMKACLMLRQDPLPKQNIALFIDSQAAIRALDSVIITSKLVRQCREELAILGSRHIVTLHWVPGHRNIKGNESADELARQGSALHHSQAERVSVSLGVVKKDIFSYFLLKANSRWNNLTTCATSRKTWPSYSKSKTAALLCRTRRDIARVTAVCTGHWLIGRHAARLGVPFNSNCRSCKETNEEETLVHYLCTCPALARARHRTLGEFFFDDLKQISEKNIKELIHFLNSTGWI